MTKYFVFVDGDEARLAVQSARESGSKWARLAEQTIVWTSSEKWCGFAQRVSQSGLRVKPLVGTSLEGQLYLIVQVGRSFQDMYPKVRVIVDKGRYLIVKLTTEEINCLSEHDELCWVVRPVPVNIIIIETLSREARAVVPWVQSIVSEVSQVSYSSYLTSLTGYPTRHTLSSHYTLAATWAVDEFRGMGYQAGLQTITVGGGSSYNVVAERQGSASGVRDLILITAHLDSINIAGGSSAPAPGADDNASGSAGVLEIARVLVEHPAKHDLKLILFGGEEQGLHGSSQYVAGLPVGERSRIKSVINMDMIATLNSLSPTVLLEGASVSQPLITSLAAAAATYTSLVVQASFNPFGSDHVPFINALIPAALTIEGSDGANANIHTASDTLAHIHYGLALEIMRMTVATTAILLGKDENSTMGVNSSSGPVASWGPNRLDAFVIGTNSRLYHKWWNGSAWGPSVTGYEDMGGTITSDPAVVAWDANRLDVFALGTNSSLYHKWWNGSAWGPSVTGYEYMGGKIIGQPKAVAWGPNRLDVFVIGTNSRLYHKWWNGSSWGPSVTGYQNMGGTIISDPEAVSWGPNRLDVFALGTNSSLYHKWWNGSVWGPSVTGYEYMGGKIIGQPKAVAWGPNRLDVFVRGTNSRLYHKWWNGSAWGPSVTGYENLGGTIISDPEVVSWGPNRIDIFAIGTNSRLYHKWWNGSSWGPSVTGWQDLGGTIIGQPRVVSWGLNRLDVFALGTNSRLYHKWWNGSSWGPSVTGWQDMGGTIIRF